MTEAEDWNRAWTRDHSGKLSRRGIQETLACFFYWCWTKPFSIFAMFKIYLHQTLPLRAQAATWKRMQKDCKRWRGWLISRNIHVEGLTDPSKMRYQHWERGVDTGTHPNREPICNWYPFAKKKKKKDDNNTWFSSMEFHWNINHNLG